MPIPVIVFVGSLLLASIPEVGTEAVLHGAQLKIEKVSLETHVQDVTGPNAIDCGTYTSARYTPDAMSRSVDCARDAVKEHRGFSFLHRGPSEDSEVAIGFVAAPNGATFWFEYDSAPCGGPGCASRFLTKPCDLSQVQIVPSLTGIYSFRCGG
jgi:hypothetical protein